MTRRLKSVLLVVVILVTGLGTSAYGLLLMLDAFASRSWPSVAGTVQSVEIESWHQSSRASRGDRFQPRLRYTYEVNDTHYNGDRIRFGEKPTDQRSNAEAVIRRYATGSDVVVYFDPENPANSVLEPGVHPEAWLIPGFGVALVVIGAVMAVLRIRS